MKKIHILTIVMIIAAIAILFSVSGDLGTYSNFSEATEKGTPVKISGTLSKDKEVRYDPQIDPNYFSFYLKDNQGIEKNVILLAAKPQEFERSEQIVLTGSMKNNKFIATDMLLKCPSKYKDEEIYVKAEAKM